MMEDTSLSGVFFAGIEYLKKSTGFLISGWFDRYER